MDNEPVQDAEALVVERRIGGERVVKIIDLDQSVRFTLDRAFSSQSQQETGKAARSMHGSQGTLPSWTMARACELALARDR